MRRFQKEYFQCDKCGEEFEYEVTGDGYADKYNKDGYWSIDLGRPGYGSSFDGCDLQFDICDKCLREFIETFKYKQRIFNSGSRYWYEE